jgi:hypothetical protein
MIDRSNSEKTPSKGSVASYTLPFSTVSRMITYSVFRLAARRTVLCGWILQLECAPVSEKRVGLNLRRHRRGHGKGASREVEAPADVIKIEWPQHGDGRGGRDREFADSPLEGSGFELSVPLGQATTSNRLLSVR